MIDECPMPTSENDRTGIGRECEAALAVAAMQSFFIPNNTEIKTNGTDTDLEKPAQNS